MRVHERSDEYLDKIIQERFSTALMSNSKWVKLVSALVDNSPEIKECKVKPIWDDTEPYRRLLLDENTKYGINFYDTAMEAMVSGKPTGWYAYKEIEWLDFPSMTSGNSGKHLTQQNLQFIKTVIDNLGQYKTELTGDNLRLYAYFK